MAQFGSALGLGPRGRGFESLCPDHSESFNPAKDEEFRSSM